MEFVAGTSVAPAGPAPRRARDRPRAAARPSSPRRSRRSTRSRPTAVEGLAGGEADPALEACELWERELDEVGEPLPGGRGGPALAAAAPTRRHRPRATLVHGDFRLGNLIVDEHGLAAVIDWELCHGGDPVEDLAWLCIRSWRFGNDELPVAGLGELEPFLDAYEAAGGARPDAERLRWWEAMGNVKWAVICARQAHDHLTGARPWAELASLGRRICEPEWDLLAILANPAGSGREAEHPAGGVP